MPVTTRSHDKKRTTRDVETDTVQEEPVHKRKKIDKQTKNISSKKEKKSNEILEFGHVYFFYRPKVQLNEVEDFRDVQRFYLLLKPLHKEHEKSRLITISKKKLPNVGSHEREWGFVEKVSADAKTIVDSVLGEYHYDTETKGERTVGAARPAGEGLYAIVKTSKGTRFAYVLEVPQNISEVQKAFNIEKEAGFVVSVKNPEKSSEQGLPEEEKAKFSEELQDQFQGRKWGPLDPPSYLDNEGAEILLIGGDHNLSHELGETGEKIEKKAEREKESFDASGIYKELRMKKEEHPIEPLFGKWA
jgi:hypothetical protein